ncbi:unnamed protein product [Rhodiola kirilowii]
MHTSWLLPKLVPIEYPVSDSCSNILTLLFSIYEVSEMKELILALTGMNQHQNDEVQVQANGEDDSNAESLNKLEVDSA